MRTSVTIPALLIAFGSGTLAAQDRLARIDSVFSQWNRTDGPGCLLGAKLKDEAPIIRGYGMANLEYGVPLRPESISESGSVAKQFTAAAVGLLALRGQLSLDDDIRKHLPEVPDFGKTITIRHLLTHTSGLRDQWGLLSLQGWGPGSQVHSLDQILDLVSRQRRLNFDPGTEYLYSNTGYALAALIVRRVSGKPLAEFSRDELFLPLGMEHTEWRDDYRRVVPGRATAYAREGNRWVQDMPFTMVHGNGGLLSSMADLLVWNDALTTGKIPGGGALVRMLEEPFRLVDGTSTGYGLGLQEETNGGRRAIGHGGATAGYRTYLVRWPEPGLSVAVWCNAANADPARAARGVAEVLIGPPPGARPPAPRVAVSEAELSLLAGAYRDTTTDQTATVTVAGGSVSVSAGGPSVTLIPMGAGRFWHEAAGEFRFSREGTRWRLVRPSGQGTRTYLPAEAFDAGSVKLDEYAGRYRSAELDMIYRIRVGAGRLDLVLNGFQPPAPMTPVYRDGFRGGPGTIRFVRDGSGRITGFRIFAGRVRDLRVDRVD